MVSKISTFMDYVQHIINNNTTSEINCEYVKQGFVEKYKSDVIANPPHKPSYLYC